jgi:inner membrane protein
MDPITQGVLGASLPQSAARRSEVAIAGLLGFLAGMSADLDVLIRSSTDPLLFLEYHRQFTHSLVFIPLGGLICSLVLYFLIGQKPTPNKWAGGVLFVFGCNGICFNPKKSKE